MDRTDQNIETLVEETTEKKKNKLKSFLKIGHSRPLFRLFLVFSTQTVLQQMNSKTVHPVPGFEPRPLQL